MKVAVIVPAYNEEKYLRATLLRIKKACSYDIIVANDGSKDKTEKIATKIATKVISNKKNKGKGSVMRKASDYASKVYDTMIFIDADGQHEPKDIPRFINEITKGHDIVFSYRVDGRQPLTFIVGNKMLTLITKILFGINLRDTQSGFKAITSKAYKKIRWKAEQYDLESEIISKTKGLKYTQLPIKIIYHDENKGTTIYDGLRIGWKMLHWRFNF